jgi:hypothetical protein
MNVYAAQEMDVFGVVAAVAEPTTDPASAAPVFALPTIIKREKSGPIHIK